MTARNWIGPALRVALVALFALALWQGPALLDMFRTVAHVTLTNRTDEPVIHARVAAFGQEQQAEVPIPPGESRAVDLIVTGEGAFTVEAELASGRKVASGETGYLTPGVSMTVAVDIRPEGISAAPAQFVR